jgi:hypothetical protein
LLERQEKIAVVRTTDLGLVRVEPTATDRDGSTMLADCTALELYLIALDALEGHVLRRDLRHDAIQDFIEGVAGPRVSVGRLARRSRISLLTANGRLTEKGRAAIGRSDSRLREPIQPEVIRAG